MGLDPKLADSLYTLVQWLSINQPDTPYTAGALLRLVQRFSTPIDTDSREYQDILGAIEDTYQYLEKNRVQKK
jgi:hypothetical protein